VELSFRYHLSSYCVLRELQKREAISLFFPWGEFYRSRTGIAATEIFFVFPVLFDVSRLYRNTLLEVYS